MKYGLGWLPSPPDKRDASYTATRLAAMVDMGLAADIEWSNANKVLDQDGAPECVAAGTLGLLNTDDEKHNDPRFTSADIHPFFLTIAGSGPTGAYGREGLKAAKAAGLIEAYARLGNDAEIDEWLTRGPVAVGTFWTPAMSRPIGDVVEVDSTISTDAGHWWFFHGQDAYYRHGTNSWGEGWADRGLFRMRRCNFTRLLNVGGEAWAVVQPVATQPRPKLSLIQVLIDFLTNLFRK